MKIRCKFVLLTSITIGFIFVVFTYFLLQNQQLKQYRELDAKITLFSKVIPNALYDLVWMINERGYTEVAASFFSDPVIIFMEVFDDTGTSLVKLDKTGSFFTYKKVKVKIQKSAGAIGEIHLRFTNYYVDSNIREMRNYLILLAIFIVFLQSFLIFFIAKKITTPLNTLTNIFLESIHGKGTLAKRLSENGKDEISLLGKAFNFWMHSFQEVVNQANQIASGNYSIIIEPKSANDELAYALKHMTSALLEKDQKIQEQMENLKRQRDEIHAKSKKIADVFNNIDQGIITANLDMSINPEHSKKMRELFARDSFKGETIKTLFNLDAETEDYFKIWLKTITNPARLKRWYRFAALAPIHEVNIAEKIIKIDYQPILENGKLKMLMVLANDITSQRKTEKMLAESEQKHQAQMEIILSVINQNQALLNAFFEQTSELLQLCHQYNTLPGLVDNKDYLLREIHTLKGSGGSFGFKKLVKCADKTESVLTQIKDFFNEPVKEQLFLDEWLAVIKVLQEEFESIITTRNLLFKKGSNGIFLKRSEYNRLLEETLKGNFHASLEQLFWEFYYLDSNTLDSFSEKYANTVKMYSTKNGKTIKDLRVVNPRLRVHSALIKTIDPCLVHLIRNAIDHGIEVDSIREEMGKGPGEIILKIEEDTDYFKVIVEDNGQGIDPDKVAKIALEKKLITDDQFKLLTEQEKQELIFLPGFTSSDQVTELSGRGIGMDIVANVIKQLQGRINLKSEPGIGTQVSIWIPQEVFIAHFLEKVGISKELYQKVLDKR